MHPLPRLPPPSPEQTQGPRSQHHYRNVLTLSTAASQIPPRPPCQTLRLHFLFPPPRPDDSILPPSAGESQRSVSPTPWTRRPGSSAHQHLSGKISPGGGQTGLSLVENTCLARPRLRFFPSTVPPPFRPLVLLLHDFCHICMLPILFLLNDSL